MIQVGELISEFVCNGECAYTWYEPLAQVYAHPEQRTCCHVPATAVGTLKLGERVGPSPIYAR